MKKKLLYWQTFINELNSQFRFPVDFLKTNKTSYDKKEVNLSVNNKLTLQIHQFSKLYSVSEMEIFLTTFYLFTQRYMFEESAIIGLDASQSILKDYCKSINKNIKLPLILPVNQTLEFNFFNNIKILKDKLNCIIENYLPLKILTKKLNLFPLKNRSNIFNMIFSYNVNCIFANDIKNIANIKKSLNMNYFNCDIAWHIQVSNNKYNIKLVFNSSLYKIRKIKILLSNYTTYLSKLLMMPEAQAGYHDILGKDERNQIMKWGGHKDCPKLNFQAITNSIDMYAKQIPKNIAISDFRKSINYLELSKLSSNVAIILNKYGILPTEKIAVLLPNTTDIIISLLGILKHACIYIPLDFNWPKARILQIIKEANIKLCITENEYVKLLPTNLINIITPLDFQKLPDNYSYNLPRISHDDIAYIIFTSGSTGVPKGVVIAHETLTRYLQFCWEHYFNLKEGITSILHTSVAFDMAVTSLWLPLIAGGTVHCISEKDNVSALLNYLTYNKIDFVKLTPSHLIWLSQHEKYQMLAKSSKIIVGGEILHGYHINKWKDYNIEWINEYGPTEATVGCITYHIKDCKNYLNKIIPIGKPMNHITVKILDKFGNLVPNGAQGELYIGGKCLAKGYLNQPEKTNLNFIHLSNFKNDNDLFYKSGDIVNYLPDGNLQFLRRFGARTKVNGYMINLAEIDNAIISFPGILQSITINKKIDLIDMLLTYVICDSTHLIDNHKIKKYLENILPIYSIPSHITYMDKFPLNENGKIIPSMLPIPNAKSLVANASNCVSTNKKSLNFDILLSNIWEEVLCVENINKTSNFFELGGTSFKAMQVVSKAYLFGLNFSVIDLFECPTINELENRISSLLLNT